MKGHELCLKLKVIRLGPKWVFPFFYYLQLKDRFLKLSEQDSGLTTHQITWFDVDNFSFICGSSLAASLFDLGAACCPLGAPFPACSKSVFLPVTLPVPQSLSLHTEACLSWEGLTLHRCHRHLSWSHTARGHPKALPTALTQ